MTWRAVWQYQIVGKSLAVYIERFQNKSVFQQSVVPQSIPAAPIAAINFAPWPRALRSDAAKTQDYRSKNPSWHIKTQENKDGHQSIVDGADEVAVEVPGHDIDATGTVEHQHGNPKIPWKKDAPNKLINEIPYGAGPNTEAALRAAALPGNVVIEITRKANDKYLLKIDGVIWDDILQPSGPQTPEHQSFVSDTLIIQSHWGSGVIYHGASVREK